MVSNRCFALSSSRSFPHSPEESLCIKREVNTIKPTSRVAARPLVTDFTIPTLSCLNCHPAVGRVVEDYALPVDFARHRSSQELASASEVSQRKSAYT